jgi:hypothetical protein
MSQLLIQQYLNQLQTLQRVDEIQKKLPRGYPQDNIIFEDTQQAVLVQSRQEVMRCPADDVARLEKPLDLFFGFEQAEIAGFRKVVEQFHRENNVAKELYALENTFFTGT